MSSLDLSECKCPPALEREMLFSFGCGREVKHPWASGRRFRLPTVTSGMLVCSWEQPVAPERWGPERWGPARGHWSVHRGGPSIGERKYNYGACSTGFFQDPAYKKLPVSLPQPEGSPAETVLPGDAPETVHVRSYDWWQMYQSNCYRQTISQALLRLPNSPAHRGPLWNPFGFCLPEGPLW